MARLTTCTLTVRRRAASDDLTLLPRAQQGPDDGRVETSENAAGNTGFDEVAVEKQEIPGTGSEGADLFGPTAPLWFFLDLAEGFA